MDSGARCGDCTQSGNVGTELIKKKKNATDITTGIMKKDFSKWWSGGCEMQAELQIVRSCLSRTSRCRVLSATLCPGECFPVRTAGALCKPPYAVKESGVEPWE